MGQAVTVTQDPGPAQFTGVPTIGTCIKGWQYVGCVLDSSSARGLSGDGLYDPTGMTVEKCQAYCSSKGFTYAGVEYSEQCYCGNTLNALSVMTTPSDCNMPCKGNNAEICGAPYRLSLYQSATCPAKGNWAYLVSLATPRSIRQRPAPSCWANKKPRRGFYSQGCVVLTILRRRATRIPSRMYSRIPSSGRIDL